MNHSSRKFRDAFWETDFVTTNGFDTAVSHIKDGQKSCRWIEDYLKQRAKAEEDYAKALVKACRLERPAPDMGTTRKAIDEFRQQAEVEASLHQAAAQKMSDQCLKLTDFREKQREERKKQEDKLHRTNKVKADLYRKMQACKNSYENKCKIADKAESESDKVKQQVSKPRDIEKAKKHAVQSRSSSCKADEEYKATVDQTEKARVQWEREHGEACDVFQQMEEERIRFVRNLIWVVTNIGSELCCNLDDSREQIRQVAEKCDEQADVRDAIAQKTTCIAPLTCVEYVPYGQPHPVPSQPITDDQYSFALPDNSPAAHVYEVESDDDDCPSVTSSGKVYVAIYAYQANGNDELTFEEGDSIMCVDTTDDNGWLSGTNQRTKQTGFFPLNYVQ